VRRRQAEELILSLHGGDEERIPVLPPLTGARPYVGGPAYDIDFDDDDAPGSGWSGPSLSVPAEQLFGPLERRRPR